jgi:hypothetical protein
MKFIRHTFQLLVEAILHVINFVLCWVWTFRTMIIDEQPLNITYGILSLTYSSLLTANMNVLCTKNYLIAVIFEVFMLVTMKNGMLLLVAVVRTQVWRNITSIIEVKRIGELRTTWAVTSNQSTLSSWWCRWYIPLKCQFLQERHGIASQEMAFFIPDSWFSFPFP